MRALNSLIKVSVLRLLQFSIFLNRYPLPSIILLLHPKRSLTLSVTLPIPPPINQMRNWPLPDQVHNERAQEAANYAEDHLVEHLLVSQIQRSSHRRCKLT